MAKIGQGGMGTVHLTKMDGPVGFNKLAVVKELRGDLVGSKEFVQMFLNEARLAARLTHPNVVYTYEANEDQGRLYLAMEYLDGQPWSRVRQTLWKKSALPLELHLRVLAETLAGLHYAHELRDYDGAALQIVHCDMSPHNVFVTYDGQVKIVDFGVARAVTVGTVPDRKILVGKIAYIAPEQARGEPLDRRADVFAVGVMLWEALAGRRFVDGSDFKEMRRKRAAGEEPRIREVMPDVPEALAEICDRATALNADDRFPTAAAFREALLAVIGPQEPAQAKLGELVADAFKTERARVHGIIERSLKNPTPVNSSIEDLVASLRPEVAEHTLKADLSELASVSRLRDDVAVIEASTSASVRLERKRPPWPLIGGAAAGAVVLATWLFSGDETPSVYQLPETPAVTGAAHASTVTNPAPTQPSAAPTTAELVVSATPLDATLLMDGVPLPSNPYRQRVEADGELHLFRASAPGMQPQERVILLDRDRTITFELERLPPKLTTAERAAPLPKRGVRSRSVTQSVDVERVEEAPRAAPLPAAPAAEPAYDAPIAPKTSKRVIYEDDPYR